MKIEIPKERSVISIKVSEAEEIQHLIEQNGYTDCLETGLAFGQSACYMLSASTQPSLVSCDPFQIEDYNGIGLKNIKANGFSDRHTHIDKRSELALPQLIEEGRQFDFIFIDGDHKFDGAFVDFFFASKLLKKGGIIIFHDMWMRALVLTANYIKKNRSDFEVVKLKSGNMSGFRKIGNDNRDGMVFSEFYTTKNFFRFHINRLAWENKTIAGKLINRVKGLMKR